MWRTLIIGLVGLKRCGSAVCESYQKMLFSSSCVGDGWAWYIILLLASLASLGGDRWSELVMFKCWDVRRSDDSSVSGPYHWLESRRGGARTRWNSSQTESNYWPEQFLVVNSNSSNSCSLSVSNLVSQYYFVISFSFWTLSEVSVWLDLIQYKTAENGWIFQLKTINTLLFATRVFPTSLVQWRERSSFV